MFFSVYKHVLKLILIAMSALDFFITITCVGEGFIEMVKLLEVENVHYLQGSEDFLEILKKYTDFLHWRQQSGTSNVVHLFQAIGNSNIWY